MRYALNLVFVGIMAGLATFFLVEVATAYEIGLQSVAALLAAFVTIGFGLILRKIHALSKKQCLCQKKSEVKNED